MDSLALARFFSDFLSKYGGSRVEILGSKNSKIFNNIVVCTAYDNYNAQLLLVDLLDYAKLEFGLINCGLEGYKKGDWIVVDFDKVFVHIFTEKAREKYNIEKLWR